MIHTKVINEINKSYIEVCNDDTVISNDYRVKMMSYNQSTIFLQKENRTINNQPVEVYDITGKISIINYFNMRTAGRNELEKLFSDMKEATKEAEKLLIEEGNIMFRPDSVFYNSKSMTYEFICIPNNHPEDALSENLKSLLQFFLSKLDDEDIPLLKTVYSLYDRQQVGNLGSEDIYNLFKEGIEADNEERDSKEKSLDDESDGTSNDVSLDVKEHERKKSKFVPSVRETVAGLCIMAGAIIAGYHIYILMLDGLI